MTDSYKKISQLPRFTHDLPAKHRSARRLSAQNSAKHEQDSEQRNHSFTDRHHPADDLPALNRRRPDHILTNFDLRIRLCQGRSSTTKLDEFRTRCRLGTQESLRRKPVLKPQKPTASQDQAQSLGISNSKKDIPFKASNSGNSLQHVHAPSRNFEPK